MKEISSGDLAAPIIATVSLGEGPTLGPGQTVALVFSSNIHGEVEPCG